MAYRYKNIHELTKELEEFHDIEFEYKKKQYSICPVNGIFAVGGKEMESIEYKTISDLVNNFKINGVFFKDIITEIDVYLH
ncbi:hypothetical protein [Pectinatus frisingensis]|uniref:hypothetical protein n=1 Tax=Pectinatus frisingensis TaxID=865 RepID=UPI003D8052A5